MGNTSKSHFFKTIIGLALLLALTPNNFSFAAGEFSGGSIIKLFESMSPEEAYESSKFRKRVWNKHMPGTSTWYKPSTSLCIEGDTLQTVQPRIARCDEWAVELKNREFGKNYALFTSLSRANKKAESDNAIGKPICIRGKYQYARKDLQYSDLTYTAEFYKRTNSDDKYDNKYFLGEHEYPVLDCFFFERRNEGEFDNREFEHAGGEFSGGSNKIQGT